MTKFELFAVALVVFATWLTPTWAQVSEPAAAAARNPDFSIYSNYPSGGADFRASHAMVQTLPDDVGLRPSARPHRAHHVTRHY
jgi:hypothetical protein